MFAPITLFIIVFVAFLFALFVINWWILATIKFVDIFIINMDCFMHIFFYDLPLDIVQNVFLVMPAFVKVLILAGLVYFGGTAGFPYLAGIIAAILGVYIIDYSISVLYPQAHRTWCKRRRACNYKHVWKKIIRMGCNIGLHECGKPPKPKKCKKEKNIIDMFNEMFPLLSRLVGDVFRGNMEYDDNKEDIFPYVYGYKEPEYRKIQREKRKNEESK
jgi:hypothetical protein